MHKYPFFCYDIKDKKDWLPKTKDAVSGFLKAINDNKQSRPVDVMDSIPEVDESIEVVGKNNKVKK